MNKCRHLFRMACIAVLATLTTLASNAQERSHANMLAVGSVEILDTYLSAEKYTGTDVRYINEATRPLKWNHISQTMLHQGEVKFVHNRANNNDEIGGLYNFQYHLRYNWNLCDNRLLLEAGGGIDANIGFLYNTRNGNNPAQARASLNIAPSVAATYRFHIKQMPVCLRYEAMAPLAGIMFSPNYGQSYYEIFNESNYDHNVVFTTIGTTPSLRQMLTIDIKPTKSRSRTWFRIGYMGDYQQAKVNNLKYHEYTHMLLIGIVKKLGE